MSLLEYCEFKQKTGMILRLMFIVILVAGEDWEGLGGCEEEE